MSLPPDAPQLLLLVEDDIPLQKLFGFLLKQEGFTVVTASTIQEAKEFIEKMPDEPFVMVSDYSLPDGNGLELREWLIVHDREPQGFLLVSGMFDQSPKPDVAFLAKPFPPAKLGESVRAVLSKNRLEEHASPHQRSA